MAVSMIAPPDIRSGTVRSFERRMSARDNDDAGSRASVSSPPPSEEDSVSFSAEALRHARNSSEESGEATEEKTAGEHEVSDASQGLSEEEKLQVEKLRARDAEVRAHEAAHLAAAGAHSSGGATFSYQIGPDGKSYAIGGEVGIDVSPVSGDPAATIQKMQQVRAAALAPGEPSGADRAVAAHASQAEAKAREQLTAKRAATAYGQNQGAQQPASEGGMIEAQA